MAGLVASLVHGKGTSSPSLLQVIAGGGVPTDEQDRNAVSPCLTVTVERDAVVCGGTVIRREEGWSA